MHWLVVVVVVVIAVTNNKEPAYSKLANEVFNYEHIGHLVHLREVGTK